MPKAKPILGVEEQAFKFKEPGEDPEYDAWFKEQVQIGIDQANRGELISGEEVERELLRGRVVAEAVETRFDAAAREAIWGRYIPEQAAASIDLALLVARTDGYSPADIEFAARSASQAALEQSVFGVSSVEWADGPAGALAGPSTADYLAAIDRTRATVSSTEAFEFREDIAALART